MALTLKDLRAILKPEIKLKARFFRIDDNGDEVQVHVTGEYWYNYPTTGELMHGIDNNAFETINEIHRCYDNYLLEEAFIGKNGCLYLTFELYVPGLISKDEG